MGNLITVLFPSQQAKTAPGQEPENLPPVFDAEHETKRKTQLLKLYNRTPEQVNTTGIIALAFFYHTIRGGKSNGTWELSSQKFLSGDISKKFHKKCLKF